MKKIKRFLDNLLIFSLIFAWLFSGWPPINFGSNFSLDIEVAQAASPWVENGEVEISDSLSWQIISLKGDYNSVPVVLATPVTAANCPGTCSGNNTGDGGMYPIPLVRNVSTTSFEISMCIDGGSTTCTTGASAETFHYFVFDVEDAQDYDWLEVGTTSNVDVGGADTAETYSTSFAATPDIWTQAQTYSQGGNIGAVAWVDDKTTSGFNYIGCVHTGIADACDGSATDETFGYVAIDVANEAFPAEYNFQSSYADISNSDWTLANFSPSYTEPIVMVTQNDDDGGQDPQYAWAQNVTTTDMDFRYCEEDAGTVCNSHTSEFTHWFAMERQFVGTAQSHFRWRDDSVSLNTDGGWLAVEDSNSIGDIDKSTTYRLRVAVANADTVAENAARTYELQWGKKTASCGSITTWTGVDDSDDEFEMVDSSNISSDGQSTSALFANTESYSFVSGEARDVADTTGSIGPMASSTYSEIEYSFQATEDAITGEDYCFRLYDKTEDATLGAYNVYPEVTIKYTNVALADTILEWGTQSGVGDDAWTTISFEGYYDIPIVICTTEYNNNIGNESDGTADSILCRVQNTTATSTQVRIQETGTNVGDVGNLTDETIHWMVVEEGTYNTGDIKMEAFSYNSTVTDGKSPVGWNGQYRSYEQSYTNPVVLGQVMTTNDTGHSGFWAHDGSNGVPTVANLYTGKHISEDNDTTRNDETIGYVVIEQANDTLDGVNYEARLQAQTIDRIDDVPPSSYTFNTAFSTTPSTAIISLAGVSGTDGPYPTLYGSSPLSTTGINLAIMETEIVDTEQSGNTEFVPYIVFESDGTYQATQNIPIDQTTYRFYENVDAVQPSVPLGNENASITGVDKGEVIRLRMSVQFGGSGIDPGSVAFKLQYGQGSNCSTISTWHDVGSVSSTSVWRGYDNPSISDEQQITSSLLDFQNNTLQSYEEENNSTSTLEVISSGEKGEWDWVLQNYAAPAFTDYCFRMVTDLGVVMEYSSYPQLTTGEVVSISLDTDGIVDFGVLALADTQDTTATGIDDVETISVDIGPADLDVRSTHFSTSTYVWDLGIINATDQVKWEFASTTPDWSIFSASSTLYSFDRNVPAATNRNIYLRLSMPTDSSSLEAYSADITIVASEP